MSRAKRILPRTKPKVEPPLSVTLVNVFMRELFSKTELHLKDMLKSITERNSMSCLNSQHCFRHGGTVYGGDIYERNKILLPRKINNLDEDLIPDLLEYLVQEKELIQEDYPRVRGGLATILSRTTNYDDLKTLLPEGLLNAVSQHEYALRQLPALSFESLQELLTNSQPYIDLMRKRLMFNLIDQ